MIKRLVLAILLCASTAHGMDIAVQYHVNFKAATCPTSQPTTDWWHWNEDIDFTGRNACNFVGGTSWLRDTNTVTYPLIGLYGDNQTSTERYRWHMRLAKAAGITAFMVSVFPGATSGENTELMGYFAEMLKVAWEENFNLGLELWVPIGSTTNADYYARAKSNIDSALASQYASALYRVNGRLAVWFHRHNSFDTLANIDTNLLSQRVAFWIIGGPSATDLDAITPLSNGAEVTGIAQHNFPQTSGCGFGGDVSTALNTFGSGGYTRVSHAYPRFNESQNISNERLCVTGSNNSILTDWHAESVSGSAAIGLIESWNDFREMTALEPGVDIITWRNSGQEQVYFGDPYYPLRVLADLQGVTFAAPTVPCSIVDSVMLDAPGFPGCDQRNQGVPRAPSSLRVQASARTQATSRAQVQ